MSCCACVKMSSKTVWIIRLLFVVFVGVAALGIHLATDNVKRDAVVGDLQLACVQANTHGLSDSEALLQQCADDGVAWQDACWAGETPAAEVSYGFDCEESGFNAWIPKKKYGRYAMIGGGGLSGLFLILCCVIGVKSASAVDNKGNQMV